MIMQEELDDLSGILC